mmetsp:Transcript_28405/g.60577  ORF Transcript_28405/g.60577 Transcript_28405/m.60577 type:complete len:318 (+) Transcript_28405:234-1187(+)
MPKNHSCHKHRGDFHHHSRYSLCHRQRIHEAQDLPSANRHRGLEASGDLTSLGAAARRTCRSRSARGSLQALRGERARPDAAADPCRDSAMRASFRVPAVEGSGHPEGLDLSFGGPSAPGVPDESRPAVAAAGSIGQQRQPHRDRTALGRASSAPHVLVLLAGIAGVQLYRRDVDNNLDDFGRDPRVYGSKSQAKRTCSANQSLDARRWRSPQSVERLHRVEKGIEQIGIRETAPLEPHRARAGRHDSRSAQGSGARGLGCQVHRKLWWTQELPSRETRSPERLLHADSSARRSQPQLVPDNVHAPNREAASPERSV